MKISFLLTLIFALAIQASAAVVDVESAAQIAAKVLHSDVRPLQSRFLTVGDNTQPSFYIFTGDDGKGFAIISADDVVNPVIGYSVSAPVTEIPDNMCMWLDAMSDEISMARSKRVVQSQDVCQRWQSATLSDADDGVLLTTAQWGQSGVYNYYCPSVAGKKCLTGCIATAYAILMKYYEYPSAGRGTTRQYYTQTSHYKVGERNIEHEFNWSDMLMTYDNGYTPTQRNAVARLMADIGASIQIDYGTSVTYGYYGRFGILQNFDYSLGELVQRLSYSDAEWNDMIRAELNLGHPVLYRGEDGDGNNGHAFIIDGYNSDNFYHINWGWSGNYNGYFSLNHLCPSSYDDYTYNQWVQLGCVPMPLADAETVATVSGVGYGSLLTALAMSDMTGAEAVMTSDVGVGEINIPEFSEVSLNLNGAHLTTCGSILNYGKLTVKDDTTLGEINLVYGNNEIFVNYGTLNIDGGSFRNTSATVPVQYDYRRAMWTGNGSHTHISSGSFYSENSTLMCFNGDAVIDDGIFVTDGNCEVLTNYNKTGTVEINGGVMTNASAQEGDYRRVIWTDAGTRTIINGGEFRNQYGKQALCFNGFSQISGAIVDAPNGYDCLTNDVAKIENSCFGGRNNLYIFNTDATIQVRTGLFSKSVLNAYLAPDSECIPNTDAATSARYPYEVIDNNDSDAITVVSADDASMMGEAYTLMGTRSNNMTGNVVIRTPDGNGRKVFVRKSY